MFRPALTRTPLAGHIVISSAWNKSNVCSCKPDGLGLDELQSARRLQNSSCTALSEQARCGKVSSLVGGY
jgi:hypothetical protein